VQKITETQNLFLALVSSYREMPKSSLFNGLPEQENVTAEFTLDYLYKMAKHAVFGNSTALGIFDSTALPDDKADDKDELVLPNNLDFNID
jgi:hypothetical protein